MGGGVDRRSAGGKGPPQRTGLLTDICVEYLETRLAHGIFARYPRDPFGRPVECGNPPLQIHGENTFVDRIEDNVLAPDHGSAALFCTRYADGLNRAFCILFIEKALHIARIESTVMIQLFDRMRFIKSGHSEIALAWRLLFLFFHANCNCILARPGVAGL